MCLNKSGENNFIWKLFSVQYEKAVNGKAAFIKYKDKVLRVKCFHLWISAIHSKQIYCIHDLIIFLSLAEVLNSVFCEDFLRRPIVICGLGLSEYFQVSGTQLCLFCMSCSAE